ncbi:hypothetical protein B0H17DRAFT_1326658 [Mycena rosella]|uniref:T6SS Phospholipase effector Tle1-like catalytic domain-containing protein n=1 Tax=Mycena rosella TaxID=1033263 RepID=A0AAD7M7G4_MYCRO|nr:hypothetical protein B0H17DRAFT_1326658 [Mycena rosella]
MVLEFIPERPKDAKYRTLIVLLDGTGDSDDKDATNIVLLHKMLYNGKKPANDNKQLVYYSTGIGADITQSYADLVHYAYQKIDQAVAKSFQDHIIHAYTWLMKNYQDNDKICIFGFSRGAYSARALAGMLKAMGLLRASDAASAKATYKLYEEHDRLPPSTTPAEKETRDKAWLALRLKWQNFRTEHKPEVKMPFVEFLGCWDSVNSVGMVNNIKLAHTATNSIVRTFRHAVALDERRAKFNQNMWSQPNKPAVTANAQPNGDNRPSVVTDVQEVWFAGCHCDVGGGSVLNDTRPNLAHISLRWMIRECFKARTGMIFSATELATLGIEPSHLYPDVRPRPDVDAVTRGSQTIRAIEAPELVPWAKSFLPSWDSEPEARRELALPNMSEEELDASDALAPLYDQLVLKSRIWKAMEWLFTKTSVYNAVDDTFQYIWHPHNSAGRTIPPAKDTHGGKIRVHRTVRMRMQGTYENGPDKGKQYIPKAMMGWPREFEKQTAFERVEADSIEWVS